MNPFNKIRFYVREIGVEFTVRGFGGRARKVAVGIIGAIGVTATLFQLNIGTTPSGSRPEASVLTASLTTTRGEHRCWTLPESSEVCLNTNSTVSYSFSSNARNIELLAGEAFFTVHPGDQRPFDVLSGNLAVRDLSTSFNVYRKVHSTVVTVVSGRVKIIAPVNRVTDQRSNQAAAESAWDAAPEYQRLHQVEIDSTTGKLESHHTLTEDGLSQITAWQRGQIDLNGRTLNEALTEFSRYQPIEHFIVPDKIQRGYKAGGILQATSLMDFLDYLKVTQGISYTITKDADGRKTVTLSRRRNVASHSKGS